MPSAAEICFRFRCCRGDVWDASSRANLLNEDGMKFAPRNVLITKVLDDPLPTVPVDAIPVLVAVNGRSMACSI